MRIRKLEIANFMRHDKSVLELPTTGLVVITGRNGHGKSSIVEGVATAFWDESVRGKPGWRPGTNGGTRVEFDGGFVLRQHRNGTSKVKWRVGDSGAGEYPTTTKSQEALESHIGPFSIWSRACCFSSVDVNRFTTARDAERKRLLEELLELDRFDKAAKKASADFSDATRRESAATHELATLRERIAGLNAQLQQVAAATSGLHTEADFEKLKTEADTLNSRIATLVASKNKLDEAVETCRERVANASATELSFRNSLSKLSGLAATCPHCEQPVDEAHVVDLRECATEALEHAQSSLSFARSMLESARANANQFDAELEDAKTSLADVRATGRQVKRDLETRQEWSDKNTELEAALAKERAREAELIECKRVASEDIGVARACCTVLGLQGVRASLLTNALTTLEQSANAWLSRLGMADLSVRIGSQTTAKSGNVSDKISFDVDGAGAGHGYLASSGGERRRIDIAVMLALSEVAQRGHGVQADSTMFVDEVFDALDEDGVEATAAVLEELAETRCVVIVTHNKDLVKRLNTARHVVVENGVITG